MYPGCNGCIQDVSLCDLSIFPHIYKDYINQIKAFQGVYEKQWHYKI